MVLYGVYELLRVLYAHAHGEGLGLEAYAVAVERVVYVLCRVSRCEHHGRTLYKGVADPYAAYAAALDLESRDLGPEVYLAAGRDDRTADVAYDAGQTVGADVGVCVVEYLGRGAVEDERLQGLVVVAAFLAAREELAVGECARAALAEGVVRVGIYVEVAVYEGYVLLAGQHALAAFEDYGLEAALYEVQCGEEPRRPRPDDDDFGCVAHVGIVEVQGCGLRLVVGEYLNRDVDLDGTASCVDRTLDDTRQRHVAATYSHLPRGECGA